LAACTVKLPEIWPEPPGSARGSRRRDHLVVEHDGERATDILLRRRREAPCAVGVEAERDDRLARAAVEARLRVGQVAARHQHALLDDDKAASAQLALINSSGGTRPCAAGRDRDVDHAEVELRGLAEQLLEADGSCRPAPAPDAVGALALDQRLDGAKFVDAALDDLDRLSTDWRTRSVIARHGRSG
jgi:hypothetical protein